ncbi:hypothetical protein [Amycolatopsis sp. NPDC006125]|uniref:hypothetical protein n=1 Tax=Amycolatopsis sp. NPDC006125 TaxID=3156730 RepID=UPI0033B5470F
MQQGQVSVWVPIVVGVIGLVGVIAGQLVNAWREDRRWTREQEREEIRWNRQRKSEEDARSHSSLIDFRDRRIGLYVEYLQVFQEIREVAFELLFCKDVDEYNKFRDIWFGKFEELTAVRLRLSLVASGQVVKGIGQGDTLVIPPARLYVLSDGPTPGELLQDGQEKVGTTFAALQAHFRAVLNLMRVELGAQELIEDQASEESRT